MKCIEMKCRVQSHYYNENRTFLSENEIDLIGKIPSSTSLLNAHFE